MFPDPEREKFIKFLSGIRTGDPEYDRQLDTMSQNVSLTPPQSVVLEALMAGNNISESARIAGVDRRSIHRWLEDDDDFRDAYACRRADLVAAAQNRLLSLVQGAIQSLEKSLNSGNTWLAYAVLRRLGPLTPIPDFFKDIIPPRVRIKYRPPIGGDVPHVDPTDAPGDAGSPQP